MNHWMFSWRKIFGLHEKWECEIHQNECKEGKRKKCLGSANMRRSESFRKKKDLEQLGN